MNIHEYQAKELLAKFGIGIPKGIAAMSVAEAVEAAKQPGFGYYAVTDPAKAAELLASIVEAEEAGRKLVESRA